MGPIGVAKHLVSHLPGHAVVPLKTSAGAVASAPWGSASILTIPWMYLRMMGPDGLATASKVAILNANYVARRLHPYFPVLFTGASGFVAHECIVDLRAWKQHGLEAEDAAKRLMDYGYHAPTMASLRQCPGRNAVPACQRYADRFAARRYWPRATQPPGP